MVDDKEVLILGNRYGKKGRMYTGVSKSVREGDTFSEPVGIDIENEYNYSPNADFFLAPGGQAMIMSAERDDTYGSRDLYVTFKKRDGTWSEPKTLVETSIRLGRKSHPSLLKMVKHSISPQTDIRVMWCRHLRFIQAR